MKTIDWLILILLAIGVGGMLGIDISISIIAFI